MYCPWIPSTLCQQAAFDSKLNLTSAQMKAEAEEKKGGSLSGSELWEVYASTIEHRLGDPTSAARSPFSPPPFLRSQLWCAGSHGRESLPWGVRFPPSDENNWNV